MCQFFLFHVFDLYVKARHSDGLSLISSVHKEYVSDEDSIGMIITCRSTVSHGFKGHHFFGGSIDDPQALLNTKRYPGVCVTKKACAAFALS